MWMIFPVGVGACTQMAPHCVVMLFTAIAFSLHCLRVAFRFPECVSPCTWLSILSKVPIMSSTIVFWNRSGEWVFVSDAHFRTKLGVPWHPKHQTVCPLDSCCIQQYPLNCNYCLQLVLFRFVLYSPRVSLDHFTHVCLLSVECY